jgi:hypothetical protein
LFVVCGFCQAIVVISSSTTDRKMGGQPTAIEAGRVYTRMRILKYSPIKRAGNVFTLYVDVAYLLP